MTNDEILMTLTRILCDLIGDDSIVLTSETVRADVPGWDSFQYVNFIVAVEIELGIKFKIADVESFETIGEIVTEAQALMS